jgi:hypothetical protein
VTPPLPQSIGSLFCSYDVRRLTAIVETIHNLVYLAARDAEYPDRVRGYLSLVEEQIASMNSACTDNSALKN